MGETFSHVAGEEPWTEGDDDISFIRLPPDLAGNIAKDCVFLDAERNFSKPEPDDRSSLIPAHSVFGLVEKFTGATTRQSGLATTLLKGVLTSRVLRNFGALNATLDASRKIFPIPDSFGGTSGGGLWRVYVRKRDDGSFEAVHHRLIGIASPEDEGSPPRITCQGMGRIEAILESAHRSVSTGKTLQVDLSSSYL